MDCRIDKSSLSNHASFVYKHLNLSLSVDFERHVLEGVATWTVDVAEHRVAELVLDTSSELEVRSVTVCGAPAPHTMRPAHAAFGVACAITLPEGLGEQGRALEVAVTYATSPKSSALQWLPPAQTAGKERPFMFSQCQAIHARSMLPCPDGPAAKFTYDATVRVPEWATALMSAVAVGSPVASVVGGVPLRTFTFEQTCPLSSYLLALAVGDVRGINVGSRTTVWAEPSVVEAAAWEFAEAERFVAKAEELTQTPYAWGRYDILCMPPSFPYGGMENPCLTFATPTLLAGDRSLANVICHEVAHSWTGNLVTNLTWEHFWLNEGWTRWLETSTLAHLEPAERRDAFFDFQVQQALTHLADDVATFGPTNPLTRLIPPLDGIDPDDSFSAVPYEKGLSLLCHLSAIVGGRPIFEQFAAHYIGTFKRRTLTSADFRECFLKWCEGREIDASSVDWDAWFSTPGMPPVTPVLDPSLGATCTVLADRWMAELAADDASLDASAAEYKGWPSQLRIFFWETLLARALEGKGAPLPLRALEKMDRLYELSASKNAEVRLRWQRICILSRAEFIIPQVLGFVTEQGRMKFVRPLYRALYGWEAQRELAVQTFLEHRSNYHPIAAKMLAQDLKVAEK
eukprot:jgi/Chrpa1/4065/Chrysochromulina_OHIO_Genome00014408-RA